MFKLFSFALSISIFLLCVAEKIRYISTEHPAVTHVNPEYLKDVYLTSRRYNRRDPFYYVRLEMSLVWPITNNVTWHFIFDELLTNVYKRSFVEMKFVTFDFLKYDNFFGMTVRKALNLSEKMMQTCRFPPGRYVLDNMTVPLKSIPKNFPFTKGRINLNVTGTTNHVLLAAGYIDMEIKEARV